MAVAWIEPLPHSQVLPGPLKSYGRSRTGEWVIPDGAGRMVHPGNCTRTNGGCSGYRRNRIREAALTRDIDPFPGGPAAIQKKPLHRGLQAVLANGFQVNR